jgi:hypothetical protein
MYRLDGNRVVTNVAILAGPCKASSSKAMNLISARWP